MKTHRTDTLMAVPLLLLSLTLVTVSAQVSPGADSLLKSLPPFPDIFNGLMPNALIPSLPTLIPTLPTLPPLVTPTPVFGCDGLMIGSGDAQFQNPGYPANDTRPRMCTLRIIPPSSSCGLRVRVVQWHVTPIDQIVLPGCPQNMFVISGPGIKGNATTAICGNYTGQEFVTEFNSTENPEEVTISVNYIPPFSFKFNLTVVPCKAANNFSSPTTCGLRSPVPIQPSGRSLLRRIPKKRNINKTIKSANSDKGAEFVQKFHELLEKNPLFHKDDSVPIDDKITGGTDAKLGEFPWHARIQYLSFTFCGGSLISPQWVLTASHCLRSIPLLGASLENITVVLGDLDLSVENETNSIVASVDKFVTHSSFSSMLYLNDPGLIKLSSPVQYTNTISPLCLPMPYNVFNLAEDELLMAGYGLRSSNDSSLSLFPKILQKISMRQYPEATCREFFNNLTTSSVGLPTELIQKQHLCARAATPSGSICPGDSGGALVVKSRRGAYVAVGVTSFGIDCGLTGTAVFANISYFLNWILVSIA